MLDAHRNGQGGIQPWTHFQEATLGAGDVLYLPFGDITDVATGGVWSNIATVYVIYIYRWPISFDDLRNFKMEIFHGYIRLVYQICIFPFELGAKELTVAFQKY